MDPQTVSLRFAPSNRRTGLPVGGRGRRVGLPGLLASLHRRARPATPPGAAADTGFTWDAADVRTRRWFPQGITSSADAVGGDGLVHGRRLLVTSWYGHGVLGRLALGSRITVVDIDGSDAPRYEHVLLVDPAPRLGLRRFRRVRIHAGGLAWYGEHLFVAASRGGLRVYRVDDLVRLRLPRAGHRFALPQCARYRPVTAPGAPPMTYSFVSVQRAPDGDHLVAGEYGRAGDPHHRLVRLVLDPQTQLPRPGADGLVHPVDGVIEGVARMQGAAVVDDAWVVSASAGEGNPGDLWIGEPGAGPRGLRRHRGVLPTGPEDVTWWPEVDSPGAGSRGRLWSLTEWPGRRWVFGVELGRWLGSR